MAQIIRGTMSDDKGHMGRGPCVRLVKRGAQLPKRNIFRMALGETSARNYHRRGKRRHTYESCRPHVTTSGNDLPTPILPDVFPRSMMSRDSRMVCSCCT